MSELDVLGFGQNQITPELFEDKKKPKPLKVVKTKVDKVKREVLKDRGYYSMSNFDFGLLLKWIIGLSGVGTIVIIGLLVLRGASLYPDNFAMSSNEEKHILGRIGTYCYNPIPHMNDPASCQVWLKAYREDVEKYEGESAIYYNELTATAKENFEKRQKRKEMEAEAIEVGKSVGLDSIKE
ncbi:MAG: hypothetical protein ABFD50_08305 [Smithella sp.]